MRKCLMHVGMDVHKDSIEIAIAEDGRNQEVRRGRIDRELGSLDRVVRKLVSTGKQLRFVYEAARAKALIRKRGLVVDTQEWTRQVQIVSAP